jgi:4-diphosphocytidyl-2-C-methyl-D-erythritol kinase
MSSLVAFSPAKINLFLAITDRRADGFHNLVSVVAPLAFGDTLWFEPRQGGGVQLECDDPAVPLDSTNLILRAAKLFEETSGKPVHGCFRLTKRIPMGAGLGGGSSNASAALRLLSAAAGESLSAEQLAELAARLGSDCPLFLQPGAVVMRGRGERVDALPVTACARLAGRRLLLFKPGFGISTPWAYKEMAAAPSTYLSAAQAEARLADWLGRPDLAAESLLFNNMELVAFRKHLALPTLLEAISRQYDLVPRMSGSGSCCFVLLPEGFKSARLVEEIREAWGSEAFVEETRLR